MERGDSLEWYEYERPPLTQCPSSFDASVRQCRDSIRFISPSTLISGSAVSPNPKLTGLWISAYRAGGAVSGRPPTPPARVPGPQRKGPTGGWVERGRRGLITATGPAGPTTHGTGYFRIGVRCHDRHVHVNPAEEVAGWTAEGAVERSRRVSGLRPSRGSPRTDLLLGYS